MNDELIIVFDDTNNDIDLESISLSDLSPELRAKLDAAMFPESSIKATAA